MNNLSVRDMEQHLPILGWLLIVGNALFLAMGVFVFILLTGIGAVSGDAEAMSILAIVGTSVALLMTVMALPGIIAGYGLLKRRSWGRVLAIVVAVLSLFNVPFGTVLGIYALWVLLQQAANEYFSPTPITYSA